MYVVDYIAAWRMELVAQSMAGTDSTMNIAKACGIAAVVNSR